MDGGPMRNQQSHKDCENCNGVCARDQHDNGMRIGIGHSGAPMRGKPTKRILASLRTHWAGTESPRQRKNPSSRKFPNFRSTCSTLIALPTAAYKWLLD